MGKLKVVKSPISRSALQKSLVGRLSIAAICICVIGLSAIFILSSRHRIITSEWRDLQNTVHAVADHTHRVFFGVDLIISSLEEEIALNDVRTEEGFQQYAGSKDMFNRMRALIIRSQDVDAIAFIGSNGITVNTTRGWQNKFDISKRQYFTLLRDNPNLSLSISNPVLSKATGQEIIIVARRISGPNNAFWGIIMAVTTASRFEKQLWFNQANGGTDIAVFKTNMSPLINSSANEAFFTPTILKQLGDEFKTHRRVSFYTDKNNFLNIGSVISAEAIMGYPYIVVASKGLSHILNEWKYLTILIASFSLIIIGLIILLGRYYFNRTKESEDRFQAIFDQAASGIARINRNGQFLEVNEKLCHLFGLSADELLTKTIQELTSAEERDASDFLAQKALNGEVDTYDTEVRYLHSNGTTFWADLTVSLLRQKNGEPDYFIAVVQSTDDRKKAELELVRYKEHLEELVRDRTEKIQDINQRLTLAADSAHIGIWDWNLVENKLDWDDRMFQLYGLKRENFGGAYEAWQQGLHPDDVERASAEVEQAISGEKDFDISFRIIWPNGDVRHIKANAVIVRDDHHNPLHMIGVNFDITQEQKVKEALVSALDREKEFSELQKKFVSLVSHEFRTPLTIIDSTAQRLIRRKDKTTPEELLERGQKVRNAVERMVGLIDMTLYASSLDEGKIKINLQQFDLGSLIQTISDHITEISPVHNIRINVDDLPSAIVADPKLLEHVFTNLLSNAIKYAPDDPRIEVEATRKGETILISVRDYGIGIPKNDLPHMFERYFRSKNSEGFKGSGIGLSVTKEFVNMHGGEISVESIEGEGSTFTVQLPIATTDS